MMVNDGYWCLIMVNCVFWWLNMYNEWYGIMVNESGLFLMKVDYF